MRGLEIALLCVCVCVLGGEGGGGGWGRHIFNRRSDRMEFEDFSSPGRYLHCLLFG